jgi:hypothetical protein
MNKPISCHGHSFVRNPIYFVRGRQSVSISICDCSRARPSRHYAGVMPDQTISGSSRDRDICSRYFIPSRHVHVSNRKYGRYPRSLSLFLQLVATTASDCPRPGFRFLLFPSQRRSGPPSLILLLFFIFLRLDTEGPMFRTHVPINVARGTRLSAFPAPVHVADRTSHMIAPCAFLCRGLASGTRFDAFGTIAPAIPLRQARRVMRTRLGSVFTNPIASNAPRVVILVVQLLWGGHSHRPRRVKSKNIGQRFGHAKHAQEFARVQQLSGLVGAVPPI